MFKIDGGLSTALEERGNVLSSALWTGELLRSAPQEIEAAHRTFVDSGAQIIISSSYQLSLSGCRARGWSDQETTDALMLSTKLARNAAGYGDVKVAASIGPYGASLADGSEYRGNYGISNTAMREFHYKRLEILLASQPDLLAIETMPDMQEVEVILDLIEDIGNGISYWVSYSCKAGSMTNAGQSFYDAVELVDQRRGAVAVGANCTAPELISELLGSAKSELPFVVYPNSGRNWDATAKQWIGSTTSTLNPTAVREWIALGAQFIGGCCGISPKEIAELDLP